MRLTRTSAVSLILVAAAGWSFSGQPCSPAIWVLPELPARAATGGEVVLELEITQAGAVSEVRTLRTTPPFTAAVADAVKRWRFAPAQTAAGRNQLVVAIFRQPTLLAFGGPGTPPQDVAQPSAGLPWPRLLVPPVFPHQAEFAGVVLLTAQVTAEGKVASVKALSPESGLDSAALDAVRQWSFEPAVVGGVARPSQAYALVGFAQPVLAPQPDQE